MKNSSEKQRDTRDDKNPAPGESKSNTPVKKPVEIGGPKGPEPTRYGDWEKRGRCIDFWSTVPGRVIPAYPNHSNDWYQT